ncbi:unnamed protein product, partial [Prorocentrum cordatum]
VGKLSVPAKDFEAPALVFRSYPQLQKGAFQAKGKYIITSPVSLSQGGSYGGCCWESPRETDGRSGGSGFFWENLGSEVIGVCVGGSVGPNDSGLETNLTMGSGIGRRLRRRAEQRVYLGDHQGSEFQDETFQDQGRLDSAGLEVADTGHDLDIYLIYLPGPRERPRTMTDRMQNQQESAWVYGATVTYVPDNLSKAEKGWACLAGCVLYWAGRMAEEFGTMCRTRRLWPTNLPKSLRRLPEACETCWRPPTLVGDAANASGKWFVCSGCAMRVACQELKPTEGTVNEQRMCLCKRKGAACTLCGQGWSQAGIDPQWQALVSVPEPPPRADRAPMPLHPGMVAGGLASGSFLEAPQQSGCRRVAEDAARVTEPLQKDRAEQRSAAAAARRGSSVKRRQESDLEAMDTDVRELQAKTEKDVRDMVERQFGELKTMMQGVMASQASQQEGLERAANAVTEQMAAIATAQGQAQEASRLIKAIAQGSPSSKADPVGVKAAAVDSTPETEVKSPPAQATPQQAPQAGYPSSSGQRMTEPQPQSSLPLAAGAPPGVIPSQWVCIGAAPLDGKSVPPAMASQALLREQAAINAGAPQSTMPPALGGYPTYGPSVHPMVANAAPPRNPSRLYTADQVAIGLTAALTTDASISLPVTDVSAPQTAPGPYAKSKAPPSKRQDREDPWAPGPEQEAAEK